MSMLDRLYQMQDEGKKVVSIDWVIYAYHHETKYAPRTDVLMPSEYRKSTDRQERLKTSHNSLQR